MNVINFYASGQGLYTVFVNGILFARIINENLKGKWFFRKVRDLNSNHEEAIDVTHILHNTKELKLLVSQVYGGANDFFVNPAQTIS